jgi:hypothetical protein
MSLSEGLRQQVRDRSGDRCEPECVGLFCSKRLRQHSLTQPTDLIFCQENPTRNLTIDRELQFFGYSY